MLLGSAMDAAFAAALEASPAGTDANNDIRVMADTSSF
jgi:hypothetical protein